MTGTERAALLSTQHSPSTVYYSLCNGLIRRCIFQHLSHSRSITAGSMSGALQPSASGIGNSEPQFQHISILRRLIRPTRRVDGLSTMLRLGAHFCVSVCKVDMVL